MLPQISLRASEPFPVIKFLYSFIFFSMLKLISSKSTLPKKVLLCLRKQESTVFEVLPITGLELILRDGVLSYTEGLI